MMASHFRIQKPYELTTLPRSLDQAGDSYAIGEVFGQSPAAAGQSSKKRKRSELAVGINGEALNLYDIAASRLITSYPIPPHASFTCSPYSLRLKGSDRGVTRYTYASTLEPRPRITLYKDSLGASGATASSSTFHQLQRAQRIVHLTSLSVAGSPGAQPEPTSPAASLIAVANDGAILCLDGESLRPSWQSSPELLKQDTRLPPAKTLRIDCVHGASLPDVAQGLFGGREDLVQTFNLRAGEGENGPEALVLVSSSQTDDEELRHVHVIAASPSSGQDGSRSKGIVQIFVAPLPALATTSDASSYRIDAASGSLLELRGEHLNVYDISTAAPKIERDLPIAGVTSFLRLSKSSILTTTRIGLAIYNPLYRSLQTTLALDAPAKADGVFRLVAHFSRREMAIAVCGATLFAVQLEAPKARNRKRRAEGLLIDSVGRGVVAPLDKRSTQASHFKAATFSIFAPQSLESHSPDFWTEGASTADGLLKDGRLATFETFMARSFGIDTDPAPEYDTTLNGHDSQSQSAGPENQPRRNVDLVPDMRRIVGEDGDLHWLVNGTRLPSWRFPEIIEPAERRLTTYAIQKAFSATTSDVFNHVGWKLQCDTPWSGVLQYLAMTGQLTMSNLKSAVAPERRDIDITEEVLGEQLPQILADIDPTLGLLLTWLSSTRLGSVELLTAVKVIMRSLELIQDPSKMTKNLLTYPLSSAVETSADENGEFGMELDRLEEELQLTEHYLGDESGNRAHGLSVAFGRLSSCPAAANVRAIRQVFKPEETLSLIYLLRMELNRDGWTSRYLDGARLAEEDDDVEAPPNNSIRLIADLLCQCIDSVGPGGWLINDILSLAAGGQGDQQDSADFLNSMRLEVSAALEGVEEAVYLRGILSEVVKYGASIPKQGGSPSKATASQQQAATKEVSAVVPGTTAGLSALLPLGCRAAKNVVSKKKVVSGGEIKTRTSREIGHLTSKKVADYSFERIMI